MEVQKLRLDDRWAAVAISNLDVFHDVGSYHFDFLNLVLPHCSKDQLIHIERCTKDVDLSPITDRLWNSFFSREFGVKATEEEMKKNKTESLKWSERFQRKLKEVQEDEKKAGERLKERYGKEASRKQSRQIRVLEKAPAPSNRISSSCFKKEQGKLMNKLKKECMKSLEVTNVRAMKMKRAAAKSSSLFTKPRSLQAIDAF